MFCDVIADPDGWRLNDDVSLLTPITLEDYQYRRSLSTRRIVPEEETTLEGGIHSVTQCALDVVPNALLRVGAVLWNGERRREKAPQLVREENWRRISARMHVRHAVAHAFKWLVGDRTEDHLEHAAARLLMAIEREQETPRG